MTIWIVLFLDTFDEAFYTEKEAVDYTNNREGFYIKQYTLRSICECHVR